MIIPDSWNSLEEFASWYKLNNYPQIPDLKSIYQTDVSISICMFKHKNFQVEFYIAKPGFVSSKHYHTFEQVIIFVGGKGKGRRGINIDDETHWYDMNEHNIGKIQSVLRPHQWHQIESSEHGLYFYNCQKWPHEIPMSSAVVEYDGESLGPLHERIKI